MADPIPLSRLRQQEPRSLSSRFLTEDSRTRRTPSPYNMDDVFSSPHLTMEQEPNVLAATHPPWKRELYSLLEQPTSSQSAFLIHIFMTFLIVLSGIVTITETVPAFHSVPPRLWFGVETTLVALFTVEYGARCVAWSGTWLGLFKWIISFYGVIDLLAILPYYIEILLHQDTSVLFRFSILRIFRLLRVFRPFRYNNTLLLTIEVMYLSVRRSKHALLAIGFFALLVVIIFSTLLYFAERGTWDTTLDTFINTDGDPTQFASIPAAAWFVIVTITTVGYGEITPRSFLGRLVTLPLLVFGLLLIALPSFVLGREFSLVWEKMTEETHVLSPDEPGSPVISTAPEPQDLSNFKLAQNQMELSMQIDQLKATVEAQRVLLERVLQAVENRSNLDDT